MQRKTRQEKEQLIQAWKQSGKKQTEFAKSHGIKTRTFYKWIQIFREQKSKNDKNQENKFVEITPQAQLEELKTTIIRYPNGVEIEFFGEVNFQDLRTLISV